MEEKEATEILSTFEHACGSRITISGRLGDDVKPYQEREVKRKIDEVK